jgi:hypothetical protein
MEVFGFAARTSKIEGLLQRQPLPERTECRSAEVAIPGTDHVVASLVANRRGLWICVATNAEPSTYGEDTLDPDAVYCIVPDDGTCGFIGKRRVDVLVEPRATNHVTQIAAIGPRGAAKMLENLPEGAFDTFEHCYQNPQAFALR